MFSLGGKYKKAVLKLDKQGGRYEKSKDYCNDGAGV